MEQDKIRWLSKLTKEDANSVGDKAANLGEIFQEKFIVPQGFVITPIAFDLILKENGIKDEIISTLKNAQPQDLHDIKAKSQEAQKLILNATIPPELEEEILESYDNLNTDLSGLEENAPGALAILKSAREPIFVSIRASTEEEERLGRKTFTNIRGNREVIDKIKICLAHMFSEEAIKRRKELGKPEFQPISIIVQKMINSEKSGVVYSSGKSGYKVEAIFGQGCTIPGKIEPDRYELNGDLEIINEKISNKKLAIVRTAGGQTKFVELPEEKSISRVLRAFEIKQICEIASKIEAHYEFPQEIEFAIDESAICILQTKELAIKEEKHEEAIPNEIIEQTRIKIRSEVDCPKEDAIAKQVGINEIGLIELEKIIARNGKHSLRYKQENALHEYQEKIEQYLEKTINGQNKVWIKLSEFKQNKYPDLLGSPKNDEDTIVGGPGINFLLKNPELLKSELLAIKNVKDMGKNVGIIIPRATSTEELQKVWDLIDQMQMNYIEVGACIDTPASAILIKEFIEYGMKHIIISLDNLVEYTMASKINSQNITDESKNNLQALTKLISRIIRESKANTIEVSAFGTSLSNEKILEPIIRKKINSVILKPGLAKEISAKIKFLEESIQNNL